MYSEDVSRVTRYVFGFFFFENFPPHLTVPGSLSLFHIFHLAFFDWDCFLWSFKNETRNPVLKVNFVCPKFKMGLKLSKRSSPFPRRCCYFVHICLHFLSECRSCGGWLMLWRALRNLPFVLAGKKTKSEKDDKFKQIKVRSSCLVVWKPVKIIYCHCFF